MKYIASVRDRETGKIQIIERDCYKTKKAFREDLAGNGYSIRFIATEETFDEECEKLYQKQQLRSYINKARWAGEKRSAERLGFKSVAEMRRYNESI